MNNKNILLSLIAGTAVAFAANAGNALGSFYVTFKSPDAAYTRMQARNMVNMRRLVSADKLFMPEICSAADMPYKLSKNAYSMHIGDKQQRCYRVDFENVTTTEDNERLYEYLRGLENVQSVEYIEAVKINATSEERNMPNDPLLHLNKINGAWHLNQIGYDRVYGKYFGSPDVKLAIIDNAVWGEHPDLQIAPENQYFAYIDDVGCSAPPSNISQTEEAGSISEKLPGSLWSHGTHCAGIAGAITDNNEGIASFASGVTLMGARCADSDPTLFTRAFEGILWAMDNGADIISASWGSYNYNETQKSIIDEGLSKGIIIVAASGNDGIDRKMYPAGFDGVISVGSVDSNNATSPFSNYGEWVDVAAPGGSLVNDAGEVESDSDMILSTTYCVSQMYRLLGLNEVDGMFYDGKEGTSMAAPLVSSVVALMKSVYPDLTASEARGILQMTATKQAEPSFNPNSGVINAYAAVEKAAELAQAGINDTMAVGLDVVKNGNMLRVCNPGACRSLQIYDINGVCVMSTDDLNDGIDLSLFEKGIYILTLSDGSNQRVLKLAI